MNRGSLPTQHLGLGYFSLSSKHVEEESVSHAEAAAVGLPV